MQHMHVFRYELVCGAELSGPAGALVVAGGAAYVPAGAETWYAGICAAVGVAVSDQADDLAGAAQLVAALDEQADDLADAPSASYDLAADQITSAPARSTRRRRACKDPKRKKLDEQRQELERWRRIDLGRLEIEREKLSWASCDSRRKAQLREKLGFIPARPEKL